jgi:biofilm protein TabA
MFSHGVSPMILDTAPHAQRYFALHPRFEVAFRFLQNPELAQLENNKYVIDGEKLFATVACNEPKLKASAPLEAHRRYIDIQYVIAGREEIGWKDLRGCTQPSGSFDSAKDIIFFKDQPDLWLTLNPGTFAIFYPEDAHAPGVSSAAVHKVVVKVEC